MAKTHFRDLHVWRESVAFVAEVYWHLGAFPPFERHALAEQIRRAAVSIPANIAEGQARRHPTDFLRHLWIARGSLAELHTLLVIAEQLGYLKPVQLEALEKELESISHPLNGLIASLRGESLEAFRERVG
jgi:four helix bundle protein